MIGFSYFFNFIFFLFCVGNIILKQLLLLFYNMALSALRIKNFIRFDYLFHSLEYYIYLPIFFLSFSNAIKVSDYLALKF